MFLLALTVGLLSVRPASAVALDRAPIDLMGYIHATSVLTGYLRMRTMGRMTYLPT